jgi:hypothetical protein
MRRLHSGHPPALSAVVCVGRCLRGWGSPFAPDSGGCWLGGARQSVCWASPLPIAAAGVRSLSLTVFRVATLALPVASALGSLLVPIRPLPTAVGLGDAHRVVLLSHARLALRIATVLARAVATELATVLFLRVLRAALQVTRSRGNDGRRSCFSYAWRCLDGAGTPEGTRGQGAEKVSKLVTILLGVGCGPRGWSFPASTGTLTAQEPTRFDNRAECSAGP